MRNKGRIRERADADIVVFDAARIIDRATYQEPTLPSEGVRYVLVNGVVVVRDGVLEEGVYPGQAVRATIRTSPGK
jgi:N-acyl-D-aspartate/D-glutamate deacylase